MEPRAAVPRRVLVRDLVFFQVKLLLDGLKDVVLLQLSLGAAVLDLLFGGSRRGKLFYSVLRMSERFDLWLNLNGAAEAALHSEEGLMAPTPRGADSVMAKVETLSHLGVDVTRQWYRMRRTERATARSGGPGREP